MDGCHARRPVRRSPRRGRTRRDHPDDHRAAALAEHDRARLRGRRRRAGIDPQAIDDGRSAILDAFVTAEEFPALRRAVDAGVFAHGEDPFAFALERVLDGVADYIGRRADGGAARSPAEWARGPVGRRRTSASGGRKSVRGPRSACATHGSSSARPCATRGRGTRAAERRVSGCRGVGRSAPRGRHAVATRQVAVVRDGVPSVAASSAAISAACASPCSIRSAPPGCSSASARRRAPAPRRGRQRRRTARARGRRRTSGSRGIAPPECRAGSTRPPPHGRRARAPRRRGRRTRAPGSAPPTSSTLRRVHRERLGRVLDRPDAGVRHLRRHGERDRAAARPQVGRDRLGLRRRARSASIASCASSSVSGHGTKTPGPTASSRSGRRHGP